MQINWSLEQILGLAPDRFIAKSSRALAFSKKWDALGQANHLAWGELPQINRSSLRAAVDLNGPAFTCSCGSRKSPCRHSLALLILVTQSLDPALIENNIPPQWVETWQKRVSKGQAGRARQPAAPETARVNRLRKGMAELAVWLEDIVRGGLASTADRPKETWSRMASRLVDAQAGLIAMRIQYLQNLVANNDQWPDPFLRECGQLYLLTRGFARYDALSPDRQVDLLTAAGWLPKSFSHETVNDSWHVIGRKTIQVRRHFYYRTWLWSSTYNRPALIARATHSRLSGGSLLTTGDTMKGPLEFAPSRYPLFADDRNVSPSRTNPGLPEGFTIGHGLEKNRRARAANPWLTDFPMLLRRVRPERYAEGWLLVDEDHVGLQLSETENYVWHLLALSGGHPITLFGEWDGRVFWPLSLQRAGRWVDCHALGGNVQ